MKTKRFAAVLSAVLAALTLSACGPNGHPPGIADENSRLFSDTDVIYQGQLTGEQKETIEAKLGDALAYYNEKYGREAEEAEQYGFLSYPSDLFGDLAGVNESTSYYYLIDGVKVVWIERTGMFYDDCQADFIISEFIEKTLAGKAKDIETKYGIRVSTGNMDMNYISPRIHSCVFHNKYTGSVEDVVLAEKPYLELHCMAFLGEENSPYDLAMEEMRTFLEQYFHVFSLELYACAPSEEESLLKAKEREGRGYYSTFYESYKASYDTYSYTTLQTLYGEWFFSDYSDDAEQTESTYRKHYIELLPGMAVCSAYDGLVLEDGDITFEEVADADTLKQLYTEHKLQDAPPDTDSDRVYLEHYPVTGAYEVHFSERINAFLEENSSGDASPPFLCFLKPTEDIDKKLRRDLTLGVTTIEDGQMKSVSALWSIKYTVRLQDGKQYFVSKE